MLLGRWFLILIVVVFFLSCSSLPVIKNVDPASKQDIINRCRQPFVDIPYRFVHTIEATIPGGGVGKVVGVTVFDPATEHVCSVIMTIEGLVLFDASYEEDVRVNRALPPFNADHFAGRMMEDVRLIFLAPDGLLTDAGLLSDGSTVCRYCENQGKIEDVIVHEDDTWEIIKYSDNYEMLRKIRVFSVRDRIPAMVELTAFGFREYSLHMILISAEPISPEALRLRPDEAPEDDE